MKKKKQPSYDITQIRRELSQYPNGCNMVSIDYSTTNCGVSSCRIWASGIHTHINAGAIERSDFDYSGLASGGMSEHTVMINELDNHSDAIMQYILRADAKIVVCEIPNMASYGERGGFGKENRIHKLFMGLGHFIGQCQGHRCARTSGFRFFDIRPGDWQPWIKKKIKDDGRFQPSTSKEYSLCYYSHILQHPPTRNDNIADAVCIEAFISHCLGL